jgi:hypothetical protein
MPGATLRERRIAFMVERAEKEVDAIAQEVRDLQEDFYIEYLRAVIRELEISIEAAERAMAFEKAQVGETAQEP